MSRLILILIMLVHGLIHLMGFAKEYQLADIKELTGKTLFPISQSLLRVAGVAWLFVCILFLLAIVMLLVNNDMWWLPALPAIVFSQVLVILYWPDAKFGTLANIIIVLTVIPAFATWHFNKFIQEDVNTLLSVVPPSAEIVTLEKVETLPPIVQKWMQRSNVINQPQTQKVYLTQTGKMRTKPNAKWMEFTAEQYFSVQQPGFVWSAMVQAAPMLYLQARDRYWDGKGHMFIKLLSLLPVVDATGPEIDQGTLVRYLSEIIWFPAAALQEYLAWEQLDETHAKATMTYGDVSAAGVFEFNADGDMVSFLADRYYTTDDGAELLPWLITVEPNGYAEFKGVRVPTRAAVTWKMHSGDYTWLHLEITDIDF